MEWFKVSSLLPTDPKWMRLSHEAARRYIEAACVIAQHETDGLYYAAGKVPKWLRELLEVGLMEERPEGYYVPAFLKWNPTKAEMKARREAGRGAARARWDAKPNAKRMRTAYGTQSERSAEPNAEVEREGEVEEKHLAPRKRDALFEAVAEVCGINRDELTPSGRGALNKAVAMLRGVGATAADVTVRAGNWPYEVPITPPGLAKHWPSLGAPVPNGRRKVRGANDHLAALADRLERG